jgi:hypothetical protein
MGEEAMTAPAIESGWAAINGTNIHDRAAGDGPPLLPSALNRIVREFLASLPKRT